MLRWLQISVTSTQCSNTFDLIPLFDVAYNGRWYWEKLENNSQSRCPNISPRGAWRILRKFFAYLMFLDRVFLRWNRDHGPCPSYRYATLLFSVADNYHTPYCCSDIIEATRYKGKAMLTHECSLHRGSITSDDRPMQGYISPVQRSPSVARKKLNAAEL